MSVQRRRARTGAPCFLLALFGLLHSYVLLVSVVFFQFTVFFIKIVLNIVLLITFFIQLPVLIHVLAPLALQLNYLFLLRVRPPSGRGVTTGPVIQRSPSSPSWP